MKLINKSNLLNRTVNRDVDTVNEGVFLAIDSILTVLTIIGNGAFIITLAKKKCLQTPSNILLGALSLSDLLIGLIVQPLWLTEFAYTISGERSGVVETIFDIKHVTTWFCVLLSFLCIVCSTLDRYVAICFPFFYHARVTRKSHLILACACLISTICIFGLLWAINSASPAVSRYIFIACMACSLVITAYCNFRIYLVLRRLNRQAQSRSVCSGDQSPHRTEARKANERNNAIIVAIITVVLFTCYLPFIIRTILEHENMLKGLSKRASRQSKLWTHFLVLLNSLVNPVVYYARMKSFRKAAWEVFCNKKSAVRIDPQNASTTAANISMQALGDLSQIT